jgi:hypothetical protein
MKCFLLTHAYNASYTTISLHINAPINRSNQRRNSYISYLNNGHSKKALMHEKMKYILKNAGCTSVRIYKTST